MGAQFSNGNGQCGGSPSLWVPPAAGRTVFLGGGG